MGMTDEEFEALVAAGIDAIPNEYTAKLSNVAIVIADEPTPGQMQKLRLRPWTSLFGLYEGVPQTKRGSGYTLALPDKITIFRRPIESAVQDHSQVKELVKETVWHEIAHHFGMDEARVRAAEARRRLK
jgi:predicted Zn-dependent protease with MMP-like domain